jgi:hypothetical protein
MIHPTDDDSRTDPLHRAVPAVNQTNIAARNGRSLRGFDVGECHFTLCASSATAGEGTDLRLSCLAKPIPTLVNPDDQSVGFAKRFVPAPLRRFWAWHVDVAVPAAWRAKPPDLGVDLLHARTSSLTRTVAAFARRWPDSGLCVAK